MPVNAGLPSTPCLDRPSSSRGGTLIATEIEDLQAQQEVLAQPDRVRPHGGCPTCGTGRLHVHSRRERKLYGHVGVASVYVLVFRCARAGCRALWRVLPKFLARHLWRAWSTVADALEPNPSSSSSVPPKTRRRWRARLRERAAVLVAVLATRGDDTLARRAASLGSGALRREVLAAFGGLSQLPMLAALVHRLVRGVRVM
jgi:hypothetical protein